MNFKEAMEELKLGKKIRRKEWDTSIYLALRDKEDIGSVCGYRYAAIPFIYNLSSLTVSTFIIIDDETKTEYSFAEACMHLVCGKKVALPEWPKDCYLQCESNKKDIFMRTITEYDFVPAFECLIATDWESI